MIPHVFYRRSGRPGCRSVAVELARSAAPVEAPTIALAVLTKIPGSPDGGTHSQMTEQEETR